MTTEEDDGKPMRCTRTETTVQQWDADGNLTSETVTVITHKTRTDDDLPIGLYL